MNNSNTNNRKQWLSIEQLADELGVSKWTLYDWSRRGNPDFPRASRLPNRQLRVERGDLEAWMAERAR
jgi:excisionase family DNA binding protein